MTNEISFGAFIDNWVEEYTKEIKKIRVLDPSYTKNLNYDQKQTFVKLFYHLRGHFFDFLWYMGNNAPEKKFKEVILLNIKDEFSGHGPSHERLYLKFSESLGVCLKNEYFEQKYYEPFALEFNKKHIKWLTENSWDDCFSAFSAYEKLDNIDYENLYYVAKSFKLSEQNLVFFNVHRLVEHYSSTMELLKDIWIKNSKSVQKGFNFIKDTQLWMWKKLNDRIEECCQKDKLYSIQKLR